MNRTAPTLLFVIGPPAVGKMTVGNAIAARTGFRVFHNHLTIEPVLRFFDFGTPPFHRLVEGFRRGVLDEVAASDLPGLVFTYVCAFDQPADIAALDGYAEPFVKRGGRVLFLELEASQEARLKRNAGEDRLAEKASKRDLDRSRLHLIEADDQYQLNSTTEFEGRDDYLRVDNTHRKPDEVAGLAVERFSLAGTSAPRS
ncbi:AAA family ATPase [Paractinoplanes lichenicola]|uniref:AAA family ATPase n=1 Tax=Paractinoplanes lichenicola TaxID=2802976 RepID=A0ABS1VP08_9ACTN|nr:AAA family ATPase [Actinoplanes lichenicola]MBL7256368.1 AAA family ATPase [Actinoplanes lichenicola]